MFDELLLSASLSMVHNGLIIFLMWAVVADILTGLAKSIIAKRTHKKLSSTKGINGLIKHVIVILLIISVYPLMTAANLSEQANMIVIFYAVTYVVSIIENIGQMGIPVPAGLKKHFEKLQDDYNNKED